jgi:seryl-tRNA synthetase
MGQQVEQVEVAAVQRLAPGHYAIAADLAELIDQLDDLLRTRLRSTFGEPGPVTEWRYPVLLSAEALRRSGYAENFPHLVSVVAPARQTRPELEGLIQESADPVADGPFPLTWFGPADLVLPPTMCLHVYEQLRLTGVDPVQTPVVTARGPAFRREVDEAAPLTRLSGFQIRECVFFGSRAQVLRWRETAQLLALEVTDQLGVDARLAPASDAFFANPDGRRSRQSQLITGAKFELLLDACGVDVAVASFNFSGRKFLESFELAAADWVVSGCLGFGLERFAHALVCAHGSVPAAQAVLHRAAL